MKFEISYGIIPLKRVQADWHILLIKHKKGGYWAFPKGHAEKGEVPEETARRELLEETGLTVTRYLTEETVRETYRFFRGSTLIEKVVTYWIAEVEGEIHLQQGEVEESHWAKLSTVEQLITFDESRRIVRQVNKILIDVKN